MARSTIFSLVKILLSTFVVFSVSAFTTTSSSPTATTGTYHSHSPFLIKNNRIMTTATPNPKDTVMRIRGGGAPSSTNGGGALKSSASAADPAAKGKKVRIAAFDSLRFFLILIIVLGHFISFAQPSEFVLKLVSQHNVAVGAFFALSGYVMAYTTTENAQRKPSPKLLSTPKQTWTLQRIFGYYPLHLLVLALFSPMFIFVDMKYNGVAKTILHAVMSITLVQAWFPTSAEIWNAPTWYLSALNFVTMCMPYALPSIATLTKAQLRKTMFWVWLFPYMMPKLGYWYDFGTFNVAESLVSPKAHPNMGVWNMERFSPVFAVAEVLLGVLACRLVMLDDAPDETPAPKTNVLSTFGPLAVIGACMYARGAGIGPPTSEFVFRCFVFVPFFLRFLMSAHRNVVNKIKDPVTSFLSNPALVWLGNLSFPIFIVHGPIGQMFFKKVVATKVFGEVLKGPANFGIYLATVVAVAFVLQKTFLQNKAVGAWSKAQVDTLSKWF